MGTLFSVGYHSAIFRVPRAKFRCVAGVSNRGKALRVVGNHPALAFVCIGRGRRHIRAVTCLVAETQPGILDKHTCADWIDAVDTADSALRRTAEISSSASCCGPEHSDAPRVARGSLELVCAAF